MAQAKRIQWVDVLKYLCIIMVMMSHLDAATGVWRAFYKPFYLAAFFFAAGYTCKAEESFPAFMYKKFRQLWIPWLVFGVFDILLAQIVSFHEHESLGTELVWFFLQIREHGDGLWFISALFTAFMPFWFFIGHYEKIRQKFSGGGGGNTGPFGCLAAVAGGRFIHEAYARKIFSLGEPGTSLAY